MAPDDLTPDAFARLSALEQSQELLRRAQLLDASSRVRHAAALDRHEGMLTQLTDIMTRQQEMQASLLQMMGVMHERITQNEAMLQRLIDMQRHRNGQ